MKNKNYNIIQVSIDQGLDAVQVGTAGGYIRLLEAPAAANVFIHLNEKNADPIPLKVFHAIEATDIERIFVTCNAIAGEHIKIVQANTAKDFKMITPASDVNLAALGSYESLALSQLDKIINPYNLTNRLYGIGTETTTTTILSKTLDCDKIKVTLSAQRYSDGLANGIIVLYINGTRVFFAGGYYNTSNYLSVTNQKTLEIMVSRGDTLLIEYVNNDRTYLNYYLEEYTLKT